MLKDLNILLSPANSNEERRSLLLNGKSIPLPLIYHGVNNESCLHSQQNKILAINIQIKQKPFENLKTIGVSNETSMFDI